MKKSRKYSRGVEPSFSGIPQSALLSAMVLLLLLSLSVLVVWGNGQTRENALAAGATATPTPSGIAPTFPVPSTYCAGTCGSQAPSHSPSGTMSPSPTQNPGTPTPTVSNAALTPGVTASDTPGLTPTGAPIQQDQNVLTLFFNFLANILSLLEKLLGLKS